MPEPNSRSVNVLSEGNLKIVAIISAYNEADIIGQVIAHLIEQGVSVYLLDHRSTDDTVAEAERYLGRGLLTIERFPPESGGDPEDLGWESILRRKEALAGQIDADWFIHHDADEFRESPWPKLTLAEAIQVVDIAICVHNALDDVKRCLASVIRFTRPPYRLIVVDDGSDEETAHYLTTLARDQALGLTRNSTPQGYCRAANQALRRATADCVVLLNSDTIVGRDWLDRLVACAESDPRIGLVGPGGRPPQKGPTRERSTHADHQRGWYI